MLYDFVAKIKNVQNKDTLNDESLAEVVSEINDRHGDPLEVKFVLQNADSSGEVLVKSQASVSSMLSLHDKELDVAINAFILYLEEIAAAIQGEISKQDGFYNNTKTFKRLFN